MPIAIDSLGLRGVNVDKNPFELDDAELSKGQNAISDPSTGRASLRKRAGLVGINTRTATAGVILGGIDMPVQNLSTSGVHWIYIGRGPTS
jgi:hypothetical protein